MLNDYEPVSDLVDGIKGVTRLMTALFSRKTAFVFFVLAVGAIASKLFLS